MLKIKSFVFNMFGENTYIVWNTDTLETTVIDPGMYSLTEVERFDKFISDNNLKVTQLINTHMHLDHIIGDNHVKDLHKVGVSAGKDDAFFGEKALTQARMFGMPFNPDAVTIDIELSDGEIIDFCGEKATIFSVPGHSPGSIAIYLPESKLVFTGDVLFENSIGRTDLVAGNYTTLMRSIKQKLFTLPDDTTVLPGHGKPTTIGNEKLHNPYVI
ncbi:MAG: MBL fold metallo-hydrolase [Muribaculaceae bacterium]|nr:MBL fold metallo-hydrolase [Muribaculaceae bacterium]